MTIDKKVFFKSFLEFVSDEYFSGCGGISRLYFGVASYTPGGDPVVRLYADTATHGTPFPRLRVRVCDDTASRVVALAYRIRVLELIEREPGALYDWTQLYINTLTR